MIAPWASIWRAKRAMVASCGADARPRRVDGVLIVAVVDRSEQIALVDDLVVDHRNRGQVAHRLGGDDRGVGADIGVVGRDQEAPVTK